MKFDPYAINVSKFAPCPFLSVSDHEAFVFGSGLMNRAGLIEKGERSGIFNAGEAGGCWVTRKKPSVNDGIPPA